MDTSQANHVSLCAGYGGIDLGLRRAVPRLRTIAYSEIEGYACANLVAKIEAGLLDPAPIWTDLKSFPYRQFHGCVHILSGGYPCQPFSAAGKRLGKDDPRHLWPWIADGIALMRPTLCFFENVEGHITLGLRDVLNDLGELGYRATWGVFSASEVGAPHQRKRVFILAHRNGSRQPQHTMPISNGKEYPSACGCSAWPSRPGERQYEWEPPRVVADAKECRLAESRADQLQTRVNHALGDTGELGDTESGARLGDAQGTAGYPAQSDEELGDCTSGNGEGQQLHLRQGQREYRGASGSECDGRRQTEPALGLHADESPGVLGQTLTLNPNGAYVFSDENISKKASARKVLLEVWNKARTQGFQWEVGRLQRLLAEEVLLSGVQLDGFTQRICFFVWCLQTGHPTQGWGLRGMQVYESSRSASQGQEPIEQFKRELGYAMCQLSYEIALERGQDSVETTGIMQGVRESSERAWALSEALPEMEEVWRSTLDQEVWEKGCFIEAASEGNRTDELRLLGNGVVPATAALAFKTLIKELI